MKCEKRFIKKGNFLLSIIFLLLGFYQATFAISPLDEELFLAVRSGSVQKVEELIDRGANINVISGGYTPLHMAVRVGYSEVVRILLEKGADIKVLFDQESTLKDIILLQGYSVVVVSLLRAGFNVEFVEEEIEIPHLLYQAEERDIKSTQIMLLLREVDRGIIPFTSNTMLLENSRISKKTAPFVWSRGRLLGINKDGVSMFIEILLWYAYQVSISEITYFDQAQESLMRAIKMLDSIHLPAEQTQLFAQAKTLSQWIIAETADCQSKKKLLEKILNYLLGSNPIEQQNLLKENVKYLLLKKYLLHEDNSDFYELKSKLSTTQQEKLKELESFLRDTYAKDLKNQLFIKFPRRDLKSEEAFKTRLNALKKPDGNFTVLSPISKLSKINSPILKYSSDSSIKSPFRDKVSAIHRASRMTELVYWVKRVKQYEDSDPTFSQKIQKTQDSQTAFSRQKAFPKKDLSAREIWSNWGVSYLEDSKRLLMDIYNHLDYIIEQQGARFTSDTVFGKEKIDILKF